jgi:hypothetical protein
MCVLFPQKTSRTLSKCHKEVFKFWPIFFFTFKQQKICDFIPLSLGAAFGILFFRNWVAWDQHSLQPLKLPLEGTEAGTHFFC